MSDFARLENVIAKLAQREKAPGEGRKLRGTGVEALIGSLLAEIDETILPRTLIFTTDDGVEIHLAIANRRLQALVSPPPDLPGAKDLADIALGDGKDPGIVVLGDILRDAFGDTKLVAITARKTTGSFGADIGVSSATLAKSWGVALVEEGKKEPREIVSAFLEQIGEADADAWLRIEGEAVTDQLGSNDRLLALGEQAAVFLDSYFGKYDALFPNESMAAATIVSPGSESDHAVLFVEIGETSAFVTARSDRVAALASIWQSLVAE